MYNYTLIIFEEARRELSDDKKPQGQKEKTFKENKTEERV
jgi:hypothetical protein